MTVPQMFKANPNWKTWTPSLGGDTTYTTQVGRYMKVGRMVFVTCVLTVNVLGTGSTTTISGLPFTPIAASPMYVGYFASLAVNTIFLTGYTSTATVIFNGQEASDGGMTSGLALFGNGARVEFAGFYFI